MAQNDPPRSFQDSDPTHGKDTPPYANKPGQHMLGDETEEQDLNQPPQSPKITKDEVEQAFRDQGGQGSSQSQR